MKKKILLLILEYCLTGVFAIISGLWAYQTNLILINAYVETSYIALTEYISHSQI